MRIGAVPVWSATLHIYLPSLLMNMGQGMIIPALPVVGQHYAVPGVLAVQLITVQLVGRFLSTLPAGLTIDRFGTKVPMVLGASLAALSGFGAAFSPNFPLLLATQLFWGAGISMWTLGRELAAADMVPAEQRGRQMSVMMGMSGTGLALGPAIGGLLTEPLGIRGLFLIFAATATAVLLLSLTMRESVKPQRRSRGSGLGLARFREIDPYFRLTYVVLFLVTFGVTARSQVTNSMLPLYTQEQIGYSPATTGFLFMILGISTFAAIGPGGIISDKLGRKWAAAPSALLAAAGFLLLALVEGLVGLGVAMGLLGLGSGAAMGSMTTYTLDIVPAHARGQLQALRRTMAEVGGLVGAPVSGVVAAVAQPSTAFLIWVPMFLVSGLALMLVAKESHPRHRPTTLPSQPAQRTDTLQDPMQDGP